MKKIVNIITLIFLSHTLLLAKPAYRGAIVRTLEDGTRIETFAHGNEFNHYITDNNGNILEPQDNGRFRRTTRREEDMPRPMRVAQEVQQTNATGTSRINPKNILIILTEFTDKSFAPADSLAAIREWASGENYTTGGATGSIRQYFSDQSMGQYVPNIDVVGPVKVNQSYKYYGKNVGQNDSKPEQLIVDACKLADSQWDVDFSKYDCNGDGKVDGVVIIYAGYGEADSDDANTIWPHSYNLSYVGKSFALDGVTIDLYCCLNEISGVTNKMDGIGTFCHEFSHVMGLPDIYSTAYSATHKTSGEWDIMDYGPYNNEGMTPPAYSAYERFFMGWLTPQEADTCMSAQLSDIKSSNRAILISPNGKHNLDGLNPNPQIFYLLENRQTTGWDEYIPGQGMLLTKITFSASKWENNQVNYSASSMGIDIIEADGLAPKYNQRNENNGYYGKPGDAFPRGASEYLDIPNYQIRDIIMDDGIVSFRIGNPVSALEDNFANETIIAVFDIFGRTLGTSLENLPSGVYLVKTNLTTHKILK